MIQATNNLKAGAKIALGLFVILLIGSIYFYMERMLFADASFIAFNVINSGTFLISDRYGSFITQMFPILASKFHLPISNVLLLYSVSFNLFYLSVAWFLYRTKQYPLLIIMAFYFTLYVSDTYFWTNNEIHQGIAWMFLNFGLLNYLQERHEWNHKKRLLISLPIFALLSFIALYTHPLVMIPFVFLWLFFTFIKQPFYYSRISIFYLAVIILICISKYMHSSADYYDGNKMHNVMHTTLPNILGTFVGYTADVFWHDGLKNYWLLWIIFIAGCVAMIRAKRYVALAFTILGCVGYFVLICLTYNHETAKFYLESEWMPIAIMGGVGFVYYVLPRLQSNRVAILLAIIFLVRIMYILNSSAVFTERLSWLDRMSSVMTKKGVNKMAFINNDGKLDKVVLNTWSLPYEMMLLTSVKKEETTKILNYFNDQQMEEFGVRGITRCMVSSFGYQCPEGVNRFYFNPDTVSTYLVLPLNELEKL